MRLDKQKYLDILKSKGLSAALTALHLDKEKLEFETFEGETGYRRDLWDHLEEYRAFSRELWDRAMNEKIEPLPPAQTAV